MEKKMPPPTSQGTCYLCKEIIKGTTIEEHLLTCITMRTWPERSDPALLIRLTGRSERKYWMMVLAGQEATLSELDDLIRTVWMDGDEHLSGFRIGYVDVSSDGVDGNMNISIRDILVPGDTCTYTYDYGSSTEVTITALRHIPVFPEGQAIRILARNRGTTRRCGTCGDAADYHSEDRPYHYYCTRCVDTAPKGADTIHLSNAPRDGGCDRLWHPDTVAATNSMRRGEVRRVSRDSIVRHPELEMTSITQPKERQRSPDVKTPEIPAAIPEDMVERHSVMREACIPFCHTHPDLFEEEAICSFLSLIMRIPTTREELKRGDPIPWAAAAIYAFGQMNDLFTRGREEGWKARDIGSFFGIGDQIVQNRVYRMKVALRHFRLVWQYAEEKNLFEGEVPGAWADRINEWVGEEYLGKPFELWYEQWDQYG
jgi:hypothetical protein